MTRPEGGGKPGARYAPPIPYVCTPDSGVVGAGVHVERLCPGQKPITPPLNAEESPWQRGIVLQKCEADRGGAILKQWIASKANVGMERTGEAGRSHGHPVQESAESRQRQHDAEIPCQDAPPRDVRPHRAPTISPSTTPHVSMVSARRGPKVLPTRAGPRGSGEVHRPRSGLQRLRLGDDEMRRDARFKTVLRIAEVQRVPVPPQPLHHCMIGSEGGLPLPSAHTTVRTVPYTAVQVRRCRSRS